MDRTSWPKAGVGIQGVPAKVYYTGSDTLKTGEAMCYEEPDDPTGDGVTSVDNRHEQAEPEIFSRVDHCNSDNPKELFAGVVHPSSAGLKGPCTITIIKEGPALVWIEGYDGEGAGNNITALHTLLDPVTDGTGFDIAETVDKSDIAVTTGYAMAEQTIDTTSGSGSAGGTIMAYVSGIVPFTTVADTS